MWLTSYQRAPGTPKPGQGEAGWPCHEPEQALAKHQIPASRITRSKPAVSMCPHPYSKILMSAAEETKPERSHFFFKPKVKRVFVISGDKTFPQPCSEGGNRGWGLTILCDWCKKKKRKTSENLTFYQNLCHQQTKAPCGHVCQ